MPGPEAESDRLGCRKLAAFAQEGPPRPVRVPEEREEAERRVERLRERPPRKLRVIQQQIEALLLEHGIAEPEGLTRRRAASAEALRRPELAPEPRLCLDVMLDEQRHAFEQVARVTRSLDELARAERHRATVATLRATPGVGPITAMAFRVGLHDPAHSGDGGQVARMIGLAPQALQSGPTRREGRLLKSGNARLRTVLIEAAWRWVAGDGAAKAGYRRPVASAGNGKGAIVGMARRTGDPAVAAEHSAASSTGRPCSDASDPSCH